MVEIRLEKVTKSFKDFKAVRDLDLKIEDKEFLVLLGPSGCGKTTTLRMIAGLEQPTSGGIYFDDQLVNDLDPKERNVAMVFQDYALYPHMSVYDNMTLCLQAMKMPKEEIKKRAEETAELLQINDLTKRRPGELSGGQRQRVALARAIVRSPSIYLLDEPLSNLDAMLRTRMRGELKKLHEKLRTTTVYVTHDQAEAMIMADRVAVMKGGLLHQIGKPREIYDHPANKFVGQFVGIPIMNLISCSLVERNGRLCLCTDFFSVNIPDSMLDTVGRKYVNSEVILGIRPEHVLVYTERQEDSIPAKIWLFQQMGDVGYISLEVGSDIITARVDPSFNVERNEVYLRIREDFIHIFDKSAEEAIV
jgi:multiple sugar transport system ATP-binding protein